MLTSVLNNFSRFSRLFLLIILIAILPIFSCTEEPNNPIGDDNDNSDEVYFKETDSDKTITVTTSTGGDKKVVGNNIIISVDSGAVDRDRVKSIIEETGGELVGQFKNIGMYQAEYPFWTETELTEMINTLNQYIEIKFASYNSISTLFSIKHEKGYCNRGYDSHLLDIEKNRFYNDMEYFLTVPLMGLAKEHISLSKVTVMVLDRMIEESITKEFDDTKWIEYTTPADMEKFSSVHGTMVAGTIMADNMDGGVNGIASSLIGDNLELVSAARDTTDGGNSLTGTVDLLAKVLDNEDIQICNMSFGWRGIDKNGNPVDNKAENDSFKAVFTLYPNVLFVTSADNKHYKITNNNFAPGGIQFPNVITVGCTKYGYPKLAADWTAYGPLINIAAPAELCPVVDPWKANSVKIVSGNSIGAPAVTSLAAILKSINSNLSPAEIKNYIVENSNPTAQSIGGRAMAMSKAIQQLLIDMQAPQEIVDKIDPSGNNGTWDVPGLVASRICGMSTIKISGQPTMNCETSDTSNVGLLQAVGGFTVFSQNTQEFIVYFWDKYKILNTDLNIEMYYPEIKDAVTVSYGNNNPNDMVAGNSRTGTLHIKNAFITERNPMSGEPMTIEAEAIISGAMETSHAPSGQLGVENFEGTLQFALGLFPGQSPEFYQYFEDNCESY